VAVAAAAVAMDGICGGPAAPWARALVHVL